MAPVSRVSPKKEEPEQATFTDITIEVRPEDNRQSAAPWNMPKH
jgi:hypothetical protein